MYLLVDTTRKTRKATHFFKDMDSRAAKLQKGHDPQQQGCIHLFCYYYSQKTCQQQTIKKSRCRPVKHAKYLTNNNLSTYVPIHFLKLSMQLFADL